MGVDKLIHSSTEPFDPCCPEDVLPEVCYIVFCVAHILLYVVTGYKGLVLAGWGAVLRIGLDNVHDGSKFEVWSGEEPAEDEARAESVYEDVRDEEG